MGDLIKCPIDGTSLMMMPDEGVARTTCHQCHRTFQVTRGELTDVTVTRDADEPTELDLKLAVRTDDESVVLEDRVFAARWSELPYHVPVTTIEQQGPGDGFQIVEVRPRGASAQRYREPGDRASIRTAGLAIRGGLVTLFAMVLAIYFYHWAFVFLLIPGAAITTIVCVVAWKRRTTRQRVEPVQLQRLEREQWLLGQLDQYRLRAEEVEARLTRYHKQIDELRRLDQQMADADGDFEQRRHVVQRGIDALDHHVENDERLRRAIAETMQTVEIEYRASRVLDHLPDDAIDRLSTSIAELDAIQDENQQLEAQLEANAEVNAIAPT